MSKTLDTPWLCLSDKFNLRALSDLEVKLGKTLSGNCSNLTLSWQWTLDGQGTCPLEPVDNFRGLSSLGKVYYHLGLTMALIWLQKWSILWKCPWDQVYSVLTILEFWVYWKISLAKFSLPLVLAWPWPYPEIKHIPNPTLLITKQW